MTCYQITKISKLAVPLSYILITQLSELITIVNYGFIIKLKSKMSFLSGPCKYRTLGRNAWGAVNAILL